MANLKTAPAEQVEQAVAARNKAKALLKKHKVDYIKAYSSYNVRNGKVRMKLWGIFGANRLDDTAKKRLNKLGFQIVSSGQFGSSLRSVVGYF